MMSTSVLKSSSQKNDDSNLLLRLLRSSDRNDPTTWKFLCPNLSIREEERGDEEENEIQGAKKPQNTKDITKCTNKLNTDGYVQIDQSLDMTTISKLNEGITTLYKKYNIPPTFVLLFDETWELAIECYTRYLSKICHPSNIFNYDILAWYVPHGSSGFSPHRDRQPKNPLSSSFHTTSDNTTTDPSPMFVTQWIALSEVTTDNSCLYVIPKQYDPGYLQGDDDDDNDNEGDESNNYKDPLTKALPNKESYQNIKALPRKKGQSIIFSHRIIHWGSKSTNTIIEDGADEDEVENAIETHTAQPQPRIAISFVCSDPTFEKPLLKFKRKKKQTLTATSSNNDNSNSNIVPPFHTRLLLVCSQLLIYYQRFDDILSKDIIKACYDICKSYDNDNNGDDNTDGLEDTYKHKVYVEFVNAMKEKQQQQQNVEEEEQKVDEGIVIDNNNTSNSNGGGDGSTVKMVLTTMNDIKKGNDDGKDDDEEEEEEEEDDAMMEEMLNAEAGGYGEFQDDYDELDDENEDDAHVAGNSGNGEDGDEDEEEGFVIFGNTTTNSVTRNGNDDVDEDWKPPAKKHKQST